MSNTPDELSFDDDGLTVVRGAFDATGMAETLWDELAARHGVVRDDRATWPAGGFAKLTRFGKSGVFAHVATSRVADAIKRVLGEEWHETERWGQPLITFPTAGPWNVPTANWHIDMPYRHPLSAVRLFAYLTDVGPGGGGTVAVASSHRLAARHPGVRSSELRRLLGREHEWFRALWATGDRADRLDFLRAGATVDGVHVRLVELTGRPGDLVVWHPALLHTVAPNSSDQPRFMLTHTALRGHRPAPECPA